MIVLSEMTWNEAADSWEIPATGNWSCIDLCPTSESAVRGKGNGSTRRGGVVKCDDGTKLWDGAIEIEDKPNGKQLDAWQSMFGYRPQGETVAQCLLDHMTVFADPLGLDACKPLMPQKKLALYLGDKEPILERPYKYGQDTSLQAKIDSIIKAEIEELHERDPNLARKVLGARLDDAGKPHSEFEDFLSPRMKGEIEGTLPRQTVIRDLFDVADTTTITGWTDVTNDSQIVSGRLRANALVGRCGLRNDTDLSSSNNWAQGILQTHSSTSDADAGGVACRWQSAADTYYSAIVQYLTAGAAFVFRLSRVVTGIATTFASTGSGLSSLPCMLEVAAGGWGVASDVVRGWMGGTLMHSTTDTNIPNGTRLGTRIRVSGSTALIEMDNFLGSDVFYPRRIVNGGLTHGLCVGGGCLVS